MPSVPKSLLTLYLLSILLEGKNHPYHGGSADRQDTRRRDAACRVSLVAPARFPCLDGPTPHFVDSTIFVDSARETWHATSLPMIPLFNQVCFLSLLH